MTTEPVPTITDPAEPAVIRTLVHGDVAMTEMNAGQVHTLIRRLAEANRTDTRAFVVRARGGEGVGVVGLYIEAVLADALGAPHSHLKYFVVGRSLYAYSRAAGDSRANWRQRDFPDVASVLIHVQAILDRSNVAMFGHPVLVELTSDDLSAVESGQMPPARFRGETRIQRGFGKFAFDGSTPITSKPITPGVRTVLHKPQYTSSTVWREPAVPATVPADPPF